ncbi:MAG: alpha/beta hydrolase [Bacteroides sp.]|nr:alpha/beta hydrolase [Bacteroides sp.]
MRKILLLSFLFVTTILSAQKPIELPLWPNGAPNTNGQTGGKENWDGGFMTNIVNPSFTVYPAEKPNGMAIIMCPGGGYAGLAMAHEGHDMAAWFNAQGITYAVLKYRMPNGNNEVPLSDAEQAIRMVRDHAAEWGVNPARVGVMGASAGGHLAASLSTLYSSDKTRPDFQILFYPVISMVKGITHPGSRENLIGKNPPQALEQKYSLEKQVTPRTPQAFIMLSSDDDLVPATNSIGYFLALKDKKVPVSLHMYPTGGHGWGFRDNFTYKRQWTGELEKWLRDGLVFPASESTAK